MDRRQHWEQIYFKNSPGEVSWFQTEPSLSLDLIAKTGLTTKASLIDVGGGASLLVDRLIDKGFSKLAVLDISATGLTYARQRLGARADTVEWYEADVTEFVPPHPFDLWHDRAVFHFLTEASDRHKYVQTLWRTLRPGGHLIVAAFAIGGPKKCSGLDIVQYDAAKLSEELGPGFNLKEEAAELHLTPAKVEQKFSYFRYLRVE